MRVGSADGASGPGEPPLEDDGRFLDGRTGSPIGRERRIVVWLGEHPHPSHAAVPRKDTERFGEGGADPTSPPGLRDAEFVQQHLSGLVRVTNLDAGDESRRLAVDEGEEAVVPRCVEEGLREGSVGSFVEELTGREQEVHVGRCEASDLHRTDHTGAGSGESGPHHTTATIALVAALVHIDSGKVREVYRVDPDHLLIVASDRISAFDVVLGEAIPHKGQVLTGVSLHWFDQLDTPHHLVSSDVWAMDFLTHDQQLDYAGRAMLVRSAEVIPMECVVRGYLYGSSWREYESGGGPSTEDLPGGLELASRLPQPSFTPATASAKRR